MIRYVLFFFFNDTAPTEIYPLPLHDALPILKRPRYIRRLGFLDALVVEWPYHRPLRQSPACVCASHTCHTCWFLGLQEDRKSTRLNSSHANISYAVFCLKKKKINTMITPSSD